MNDIRDANVQRLAAIVSARVQALLATSIFFNARKSVGSGSVFSLSFGPFLSLFLRNKRERKGHLKKLFYFKIVLTFFFFIAIKEEKSKQKRRNDALFPTTLRLWFKWMYQAELALSRSLKNARGAIVVHFKF